jgi:hypothetical protein
MITKGKANLQLNKKKRKEGGREERKQRIEP